MNLTKKQLTIIVIFLSIIVVLLFIYILLTKSNADILGLDVANYNLEVERTYNCNNEPVEYLKINDYTVYTYCLDNIMVKNGKNKEELRGYYLNNPNIIENMINNFEVHDKYRDGGSIMYDSPEKLVNQKIKILKCNTIDGNHDVYIGSSTMEYEDNFCKKVNADAGKSYIATYQIYNILDSNDGEYFYITIRAFQDEEVDVVKIKKSINPDIAINKNYEFTFNILEKTDLSTIDSIFTTAELVSVVETEAVGLEQANGIVE